MHPSFDDLLRGLPHRPPFHFVDEILAMEPGVTGAGARVFPASEPFFAGHFPGDPIVPGVILTEALAQMAGLVAAAGEPGARFLLSAIRLMKFPRAARPDERVDLSATATGHLGALISFSVRARVGDATVAEGEIMLNRTNAR